MPRNRRPQPKAEKRAELIGAARALFVRDGYDATPMNRIADAAQVTPNTIYWYFRDKDELLVGVLDALVGEVLVDYASIAQRPLAYQLAWGVERLRQVSGLVSTVHTRINVCPALDAWHTRFHGLFERLVARQLPGPVPANVREAEAKVVAYTIEGLIAHDRDPAAARRVCKALAARLLALAAP